MGLNMKRDMDLIRKIILSARDSDEIIREIDGVDSKSFAAHVQWLYEAGLVIASISGGDRKQAAPDYALLYRLTWAGQDFADSIIDDTLWQKAKENVIKPTSSWTFSILLEYLSAEIRLRLFGP